MQPLLLPNIIALLNATSLLSLLAGFFSVKAKKVKLHKLFMIIAVCSSVLFLFVYLLHHYEAGTVYYPHNDWTKILYLIILIPHTIIAVLMLPFVFLAVRYGVTNQIEKHKRVVKWLFPVWVYISLSGLAVYFMLYRL